jgi:hypothetical protein
MPRLTSSLSVFSSPYLTPGGKINQLSLKSKINSPKKYIYQKYFTHKGVTYILYALSVYPK